MQSYLAGLLGEAPGDEARFQSNNASTIQFKFFSAGSFIQNLQALDIDGWQGKLRGVHLANLKIQPVLAARDRAVHAPTSS